MKHIFTYLLGISVVFNIYFLVKKVGYMKEEDENRQLLFWKDISHKEGYQFFRDKMKTDFPETDLSKKTCLVYFWDSTSYDLKHVNAMRILDSLATTLGPYTFSYIFATEMNETVAKEFLKRSDTEFKNFKVIGGMDDFISGVYNEKPVKWKRIGPRQDSSKMKSNFPDMSKMKVKGYYFLMDNKGNILYYNYKNSLPNMDTALMRRLSSFVPAKSLKSLD